jgi:hypothetical protein
MVLCKKMTTLPHMSVRYLLLNYEYLYISTLRTGTKSVLIATQLICVENMNHSRKPGNQVNKKL